MTSRDFAFWLQGFFGLNGPTRQTPGFALTAEQTACVMRHLDMVFAHEIDPSKGGPEKQAALNAIHSAPARPSDMILRC